MLLPNMLVLNCPTMPVTGPLQYLRVSSQSSELDPEHCSKQLINTVALPALAHHQVDLGITRTEEQTDLETVSAFKGIKHQRKAHLRNIIFATQKSPYLLRDPLAK